MSNQSKLLAWQETKLGLVIIVLFDLLVAYGFASMAVGSGSLLQYFIAIIFLFLAIAAVVKLIKKVFHRAGA